MFYLKIVVKYAYANLTYNRQQNGRKQPQSNYGEPL